MKPSAGLFAAAPDKLAHDLDDKAFTDRITDAGYKYTRAGENVARNAPTPNDVLAVWLDSPPHKANILNKDFTEISLGTAKNDKGEPYWTQVFATPR